MKCELVSLVLLIYFTNLELKIKLEHNPLSVNIIGLDSNACFTTVTFVALHVSELYPLQFYMFRIVPFAVLHVQNCTLCSFTCSELYPLQFYMFRIVSFAVLHVQNCTLCSFTCSELYPLQFYMFRIVPFAVLQDSWL